MAELYVFKTNFEPVFLPGEIARLVTSEGSFDAECVAVGALPEYTKDFGTTTAATWFTDKEDSNLEMNKNELSQLRMQIVDDVKLRFNNLGPVRQWRTSKTDFYLRQFPAGSGEDFLKEYLFKASEFFIWEDDTPRFDFYSEVASATTIRFSGWRFKVKKVNAGGRVGKTIWVSGWPSGAAA